MKEKPYKGDWIEKVMEDLKDIDMSLRNESEIEQITKAEFKQIVKQGVRENAFKHLEAIKLSHDKVRHIEHRDMKNPQEYINCKDLDNKT